MEPFPEPNVRTCSKTLLPRLTSLALLLAAWIALAVPVSAGEAGLALDLVFPPVGALGTTLTLTGQGFGDLRGRVDLTSAASPRRWPLLVLSWSDTEIVARVRVARFDSYDVNVRPRMAGQPLATAPGAFVLAPFVLNEITPPAAAPKQEVVLRGVRVGDRRGRVLVGGFPARVTRWEAVVESPGDGGPPLGEVAFLVPPVLSDNVYDVELISLAGKSFLDLVLEVVDGGVPRFSTMSALIDGKRMLLRGGRVRWVDLPAGECEELTDGTCFVVAGLQSYVRGLLIVLVDGTFPPNDGPKDFGDDDCLLAYEKGGKGAPSYVGPGGGVEIERVKLAWLVSGSFQGTLQLVEGEGSRELLVERGRFYDVRP